MFAAAPGMLPDAEESEEQMNPATNNRRYGTSNWGHLVHRIPQTPTRRPSMPFGSGDDSERFWGNRFPNHLVHRPKPKPKPIPGAVANWATLLRNVRK